MRSITIIAIIIIIRNKPTPAGGGGALREGTASWCIWLGAFVESEAGRGLDGGMRGCEIGLIGSL